MILGFPYCDVWMRMFEGLRLVHWKTDRRNDGVLVLSLDRADEKVNALNRAVIDELSAMLERIALELPKGVVIRSGKPGGIPGADIKGFEAIEAKGQTEDWIRRGEAVCATVYGENYRKLRESVRTLHPAIDAWMITEGYGRTLGRPGLDLMRRELCTVAQTAVLEAPKQLHSHLRGALNAGASFGQIEGVLSIVNPLLSFDQWKKVKELWRSVRDGWSPGN